MKQTAQRDRKTSLFIQKVSLHVFRTKTTSASLDFTIRISTESQRKNKLTTIIKRPRGRITQSCHLTKRQLPLKVCRSSGAVPTGLIVGKRLLLCLLGVFTTLQQRTYQVISQLPSSLILSCTVLYCLLYCLLAVATSPLACRSVFSFSL